MLLERQNVTLSLPKNLLQKAKIVAIEYETSLSGLMVKLLAEIVGQRDQYAIAKRKHLKMLEKGIDMGTKGTINWTRESLYER